MQPKPTAEHFGKLWEALLRTFALLAEVR